MEQQLHVYGLRVHADYSSVDFGIAAIRFDGEGTFDGRLLVLAGAGTLTVSGDVTLTVQGSGTLRLVVEGAAHMTMASCVARGMSLALTTRLTSDAVVRIVHHVVLETDAQYTERCAARVQRLFDYATTVVHEGRATSTLASKVAVEDGGKAIVRGRIVMPRGAEGGKGAERIDALLLGERAEADVLPTLAVDTDDVACHHAATVGHLDAEALYYLGTRGLSPGEAQRMMVEAFLV